MIFKAISLPILALGICASSHAATITLLNGDFAAGNVAASTANNWTSVNGSGSNPSGASNYWLNNLPSLPGGTLQIKSDGGNYIQQGVTASDQGVVNATTFNSFTVNFDYGYRRDGAINGDHTIRISLWNTTDNVEIAGTNLLIVAPGITGTNTLSNGSFVLNYDNTVASLAGDSIAIRFTSTSGDLETNAWQRTAILDNVSITAVPEPSIALLGGLGVLGLLRRRR